MSLPSAGWDVYPEWTLKHQNYEIYYTFGFLESPDGLLYDATVAEQPPGVTYTTFTESEQSQVSRPPARIHFILTSGSEGASHPFPTGEESPLTRSLPDYGGRLDRIQVTNTITDEVLGTYYPVGHPGRPLSLTWIFNPGPASVTFTGVAPGSTITRTDPVHGTVPVDVVDNGDGTATATDPWPPLNSNVEYTVTEPDSTTTTIIVDTTVEGPDGPGSDPLPRLSVPSMPALELPPVTLIEYTGAYPARNTVHDILDRTDPVVVQREPGLRRGELTYLFDDHAAAMQIADAYRTGAKIALRQATHDRLDVVHIATGDVQITPEHGGLAWRLRVAYTEVTP